MSKTPRELEEEFRQSIQYLPVEQRRVARSLRNCDKRLGLDMRRLDLSADLFKLLFNSDGDPLYIGEHRKAALAALRSQSRFNVDEVRTLLSSPLAKGGAR